MTIELFLEPQDVIVLEGEFEGTSLNAKVLTNEVDVVEFEVLEILKGNQGIQGIQGIQGPPGEITQDPGDIAAIFLSA